MDFSGEGAESLLFTTDVKVLELIYKHDSSKRSFGRLSLLISIVVNSQFLFLPFTSVNVNSLTFQDMSAAEDEKMMEEADLKWQKDRPTTKGMKHFYLYYFPFYGGVYLTQLGITQDMLAEFLEEEEEDEGFTEKKTETQVSTNV